MKKAEEPGAHPVRTLAATTAIDAYVAPHPVAQMTIGRLASLVRAGQIPTNAGVRLPGRTDWISAQDAIAMCPAVQPTRAMPAILAALALPVALLGLHLAVIGGVGSGWLWVLVAVGIVTAVTLATVHRLRVRPARELFRIAVGNPLVLAPLGAVVLGLEIMALASGVPWRMMSNRIDPMLRGDDSCAVADLDESDVDWLNAQPGKLTDERYAESRPSAYQRHVDTCGRKRKREAMEAECEEVANAIAAGKAPPDVAELGGGEQVLARRIANRKLMSGDLTMSRADLFCSDSSQAGTLWDAFVSAARASSSAWALAFPISTELLSSLERVGLTEASRDALRDHAISTAEEAVKADVSTELDEAMGICGVARRLKAGAPAACQQVVERHEQLVKREEAEAERKRRTEEAKQKRAEARCTALRKARQACIDRCEARLPKDELGFPLDFDQSMKCGERCEQQVKVPDDC